MTAASPATISLYDRLRARQPRVPVTVLFGDSRQVAVSGALKQGDRVVVRGAGSLQDGDKVELFRGWGGDFAIKNGSCGSRFWCR